MIAPACFVVSVVFRLNEHPINAIQSESNLQPNSLRSPMGWSVSVGWGVSVGPPPKYVDASDTYPSLRFPLRGAPKNDNFVSSFFTRTRATRRRRALGSAALTGDRLRTEGEAAPVAETSTRGGKRCVTRVQL